MAVAELHPSPESLAAFVLGSLDDAYYDDVENHLASCATCQDQAASVPADGFVSLIRAAQAQLHTIADTDRRSFAIGTEIYADGANPELATEVEPATPADSGPDMAEVLRDHPRYTLVRVLGRGGMGTVYLAEHRLMHRLVALKVIHGSFVSSRQAVDRFHREVHAAAILASLPPMMSKNLRGRNFW